MSVCLNCNALISRNAAMTKHGYSGCMNHPEWKYHATVRERVCPEFVQATVEAVQRRHEWSARLGAA